MGSLPMTLGPREGEILYTTETLEPKEGIVVVLDALGMKRALNNSSAKDVFSSWRNVINEFSYEANVDKRNNFRVFSDTIIITVSRTGTIAKELLFDSIGRIISRNIVNGINNGIFLWGSLSYGQYFESTKLVLGDAINQASICHERTEWVGLSVYPGADYSLGENGIFVNYQIPYKSGLDVPQYGFALDWTNERRVKDSVEVLENKMNSVEPKYSKYYSNTLNFYYELHSR